MATGRPSMNFLCKWCRRQFRPAGTKQMWCSAICSLWDHVEQQGADECWPCTLAPTSAGYVLISYDGQLFYGHVLTCETEHGPLPKGMYATHSCDNPGCCNGAHIRPGTPSSNTLEAYARGRRASTNYATGNRHGKHRKAAELGCV